MLYPETPPLLDNKWRVGDLVWFLAPLRICQRDGQLIKTAQVSTGPYQVVDKISLGIIIV